MTGRTSPTRTATGRAQVVREIRAAAPLMADLVAPVTARAPWLTVVLNVQAAHPWLGVRPVAVVVDTPAPGRPDAAAFLALRRRGWATRVTLLGQDAGPVPPGHAPSRLLARDPAVAEQLADGICALLDFLRGPWRLRLTGLPIGNPTARALAARQRDSVIGNERSSRLVDALDEVGTCVRSRDPRILERWLPQLLAREPDRRLRDHLRTTARLHAAIGQVELAVIEDRDVLRAGLLTLVDGADRWPWWGWTDDGGLDAEPGAPVVTLTAPARRWP